MRLLVKKSLFSNEAIVDQKIRTISEFDKSLKISNITVSQSQQYQSINLYKIRQSTFISGADTSCTSFTIQRPFDNVCIRHKTVINGRPLRFICQLLAFSPGYILNDYCQRLHLQNIYALPLFIYPLFFSLLLKDP